MRKVEMVVNCPKLKTSKHLIPQNEKHEPTKTYDKPTRSGSLSSSTSVSQVTERRDLTTTNGTCPWSSATHAFVTIIQVFMAIEKLTFPPLNP